MDATWSLCASFGRYYEIRHDLVVAPGAAPRVGMILEHLPGVNLWDWMNERRQGVQQGECDEGKHR
jgi:hypothetical protein